MIVKLTVKDLRAHHQFYLYRILLPWMAIAGCFLFQFYTWNVYVMHASMAVAVASTAFSFSEVKNTRVLSPSLPVSRRDIVIARYLTSMVIAVLGTCVFFVIANLIGRLFPDGRTSLEQVMHVKAIMQPIFLHAVMISLFLPATFRFNLTGVILAFVFAGVTAIIVTAVLYVDLSHSFRFFLEAYNHFQLLLIFIIILFAPILSAMLSIVVYQKTDL